MRITLNIDDNLMRAAKESAAGTGRTITAVIVDALRDTIGNDEKAPDQPFKPVVSQSRPLPGIDLDDSAALIDFISADVPD